MSDIFSVHQFFADESNELVAANISAQAAVELAKRLTESLGGVLGTTRRIIITDSGDFTVFEWRFGEGVTYPTKQMREAVKHGGCRVCGRPTVLHGSEVNPRSETGCHDGVLMDDDVYAEGWQRDVIYRPCPYNPAACVTCQGSGEAPQMMSEALGQDDCADCKGTGWKDGKPQWPVEAPKDEAAEEDAR